MGDRSQFYMGNEKIPTSKAQHKWSKEMVHNLEKCKKDILFFAQHFFYIVSLDHGKIKIPLYKCQKRILRSLKKHRFVITLASRQIGKTTLMTIYALWLVCFHKDQSVLVVANKERTAINIFKRIRLAYEALPNYLKPGVISYGKTSFELENGSEVSISTTSSDAGRGTSINCLILDELAHIPMHLIDDFWEAVFPIISSSKKSKIFVASTHKGIDNKFYKLYTEAAEAIEAGEKSAWHPERVDWWEIPGRDEQWAKEMEKTMGSKEAFDQEFGNIPIVKGDSLFGEFDWKEMEKYQTEPFHVFRNGAYKVWEEPSRECIYVAGVDCSEGIGKDSNVCQILNITDLRNITQAAEFSSNTINSYEFARTLNDILYHWGAPPVLIERNTYGGPIIDSMHNHYNYTNIVSYAPSTGKVKYDRLGVFAHTNTKYRAMVNMRYWLNELKVVRPKSEETLNEFKVFKRHENGTWGAPIGEHDDKVFAFAWALLILDNSIVGKYFNIVEVDENGRPMILEPSEFTNNKFTKLVDDGFQRVFAKENAPEMPAFFDKIGGSDSGQLDLDMAELESQGYTQLYPSQ